MRPGGPSRPPDRAAAARWPAVAWGARRQGKRPLASARSLRHQHLVDHMNDAMRRVHVANRHFGRSAGCVHQIQIATLHPGQQAVTRQGVRVERAIGRDFDLLGDIRCLKLARHHRRGQNLGQHVSGLRLEQRVHGACRQGVKAGGHRRKQVNGPAPCSASTKPAAISGVPLASGGPVPAI